MCVPVIHRRLFFVLTIYSVVCVFLVVVKCKLLWCSGLHSCLASGRPTVRIPVAAEFYTYMTATYHMSDSSWEFLGVLGSSWEFLGVPGAVV